MRNPVKKFLDKLNFNRKKACQSLKKTPIFEGYDEIDDELSIIKNRVLEDTPDFDPVFYKKSNPDTALLDPYFHYWKYGKFEDRYYKKINLIDSIKHVKIDNHKENILIVTHELSRTGCPILSLNIASHLRTRYNVFALPLRKGSILKEFKEIFDVVLDSSSNLFDALILYNELNNFFKKIPIKFKYAIVNSLMSRHALPPIANNFIPTISLIHEFASCINPRTAIRESLLWGSQTVFSAQLVLDDNAKYCSDLNNFDIKIIPQGKCESFSSLNIPSEEEDEIVASINSDKKCSGTALILGCGFVHIRKGVDLFLLSASSINKKGTNIPYKFIWAGGGFSPETDLSYSSYIQDQVDRSGIDNNVKFIGEIRNIDRIYDIIDILFLSSRLDPLPNVAIEAMHKGIPVVCFDKTTGIAEILKKYDCGKYCVAPYLDIQKASELILYLIENKDVRNIISKQMKKIANEYFNMSLYVKNIDELAKYNIKEAEKYESDYNILLNENCIDTKFIYSPCIKSIKSKNTSTLFFIHSWRKGIDLCKPYPGFHPGIYAEDKKINCREENPLVNFILNSKPDGRWNYSTLTLNTNTYRSIKIKNKTAIHIYCTDHYILKDILNRLDYQNILIDLYISVFTESAIHQVKECLKNFHFAGTNIQKINRGESSIYTFLAFFRQTILEQYDFLGHVCTNVKHETTTNESYWLNYFFEHLLAGKTPTASLILDEMNKNPNIGLVFPEEPRVSPWPEDNRLLGLELAQKLGIRVELARHHNYPSEAMFWARPQALRPLIAYNLPQEESAEKLFPSDKPVAQAIERLLPYIVKSCGFDCLQTHVSER